MSGPEDAWAWRDLAGLAAMPVLIAINGFFVSAEFALVTIRRTEIEELVAQKKPGALAAREAVERLDDAIAATQLGITMASLALGWVGEAALARVLMPLLAGVGSGEVAAHAIAATISLALITGLHVVLGELAPKSVALQRPRTIALVVARPLLVFAGVFKWPIALLNGIGALVVRSIGLEPTPGHSRAHSVEELRMLVDETKDAGILRGDQADAVKNIFQLRAKTVREVLLPLERVAMIDRRWPGERVLETARNQSHTRLPVYDGERAKVVGIVNTKDLLRFSGAPAMLDVANVMRSAAFVAPEVPIADLLRDMKRYRRQMALVRNSSGGAIGVVTLEDVIEEIVGEIDEERSSRGSMVIASIPDPTASTVLRIEPPAPGN